MSAQPSPAITLRPRQKRPVGVWGMTIIDGLFAGVYLVAEFFRMISHPGYFGVSTAQVVLWGVAGLAICMAAQLTWYGSRHGRTALLALMTVFLGFVLLDNAKYFVWAVDQWPDNDVLIRQQVVGAIRSLVWLAANFWFLTGRRTKGFFW
jgi:hypothetical protein